MLSIQEVNEFLALHESECVHDWKLHEWTRKGISGHSTPTVEREWRCEKEGCNSTRFAGVIDVEANKPPSIDTPRANSLDSLIDYADKRFLYKIFTHQYPDGNIDVTAKLISKDGQHIAEAYTDHAKHSSLSEAFKVALGNAICNAIKAQK